MKKKSQSYVVSVWGPQSQQEEWSSTGKEEEAKRVYTKNGWEKGEERQSYFLHGFELPDP